LLQVKWGVAAASAHSFCPTNFVPTLDFSPSTTMRGKFGSLFVSFVSFYLLRFHVVQKIRNETNQFGANEKENGMKNREVSQTKNYILGREKT
jgi:hypothetical protein